MKKLPEYFIGRAEVKGIHFDQLKREGDVCLYARSDGYYEIVKPRKQAKSVAKIQGREVHFEEKEIYPTGESWEGKCFSSKKRAEAEFINQVKLEARERLSREKEEEL